MKSMCPLYFEDTHPCGQAFDRILLMIHGNISSLAYWKPLIKEINNPMTRCIAVDLRGFGRSQQVTSVDSVKDLSDDVDEFVRTTIILSNEQIKEKLYLTGWSLGGAVCMQLAIDYPERYGKLILIASVGVSGYPISLEDELGDMAMKCQTKDQVKATKRVSVNAQKIIDKDLAYWEMVFKKGLFNSGLVPSEEILSQLIQETFLQTNYVDCCWALNSFDISGGKLDKAKDIEGPVLIYHGELDLLIPPIMARGIAVEIGEEKCQVVIKPELGHMIPLEKPDELANTILEFIYH